MEGRTKSGWLTRLAEQPVPRILSYYIVLTVVILGLAQWDPHLLGAFSAGVHDQVGQDALNARSGSVPSDPYDAARAAGVAIFAAFLLMVPVAWMYVFTRRKKGFQQSMVQTLIILPTVVAGVVILVRNSVALAFSLGGIVGAISFRHTLDDTKDAVHIFLAIGVGVAAGVQVMSVAIVLSVAYVALNLLLWYLDFGRVPPPLVGPPAERRLAQLQDSGRGVSGGGAVGDAFVSQIDDLLLKSMAPEQLEVVAERAWKRRRRLNEQVDLGLPSKTKGSGYDTTVRVQVAPAERPPVREAIEAVLSSKAKRWQVDGNGAKVDGHHPLTYHVRFKKKVPGPLLLEALRKAVADKPASVEMA